MGKSDSDSGEFETRSIGVQRPLAFLLLFLSLGTAAYSQQVLSIPPLSSPTGVQLTVPVELSDGSGIAEVRFTLSYDPGVLAIPEFDQCGQMVTAGNLLTGQDVIASCNSLGQVIVSVTCQTCTSFNSGSGTVVEIQFNTIGAGGCGLAFSAVSANSPSGSDVAVTSNSGTCSIGQPPSPGPFLAPGSDPSKSHVLKETNEIPGPQPDDLRELTFEREGNRILVYRGSPPEIFRELQLLNHHPVTGVPQDFVVINPNAAEAEVDGRQGFLESVRTGIKNQLQVIPRFRSTTIVVDQYDSNFRPVSAQIQTEFSDGNRLTSSFRFDDRDDDGIGEVMAVALPFLPEMDVTVELFQSTDGTPEYVRLAPPAFLGIEPVSYLPLGDTNGDGVPDSPAFDFDGDGVPDPDLPLTTFLAGQENPVSEVTLHFAQFGDGSQSEGSATRGALPSIFSQIALFNLDSDQPAQAKILLRKDDGTPLSVDLDGEMVKGEKDIVIPAGGLRILRTDGQGPVTVGSVTVRSDRAIAGVILFGGSAGVAGVGISQVLHAGFVAPMETDGTLGINTGIAVMNIEDAAQTLQVALCDTEGSELATAILMLSGLGHRSLFVDEFTWQIPGGVALDFSSFHGLLKVAGSGRIAATAIQTRPGEFATLPVSPNLSRLRFGTVGNRVSRTPAREKPLDQKLNFAQFGKGTSGDQRLFSQIILINSNASQARAKLLIRGDGGEDLAVQLKDLDGTEIDISEELVVPAGGIRILRTDSEGDVVSGSVVLCSDQSLSGVILFGGTSGVAGVGNSAQILKRFTATVESRTGSINTGVAVMNLESEAMQLAFSLCDEAGRLLATAAIDLAPSGHRALFLNEVDWMEEEGVELDFSDFRGLLKISGDGKTAATVLQTRRGVLATQPVVPALDQR